MNALEALEKLDRLNKKIEALDVAFGILWDDFDKRIYANRLADLRTNLTEERDELEDRLSAVKL